MYTGYRPLSDRIEMNVERVPESGCWVWLGFVDRAGYGQISVHRKNTTAHRAAYEAFVGPAHPDLHVCHRCDVRCCVNPGHLFLGTPKENQQDMARKNRSVYGEKNGRVKLTAQQVLEIRASTLPQRELARMYGVGQSHIQRVRTKQVWQRV